MTYNAALETGGVLIGDEVKVSIEIEAVQYDEIQGCNESSKKGKRSNPLGTLFLTERVEWHMNLVEEFGNIDIYLFDQLLKGRITKEMRILDAGSGAGRNLTYFLRNGYHVYAVDRSPEAIGAVQRLGRELAPFWSEEQARVEAVEDMSFTSESFDFVISNAVLHFAENERHFLQMVHGLWRVLKSGGILFVRLASSIGIESKINPIGDGRYQLPDGSTRFLVDEAMIERITQEWEGTFVEPLKTVHVAGHRCMSTWCVRKPQAPS